jgi:hypothetical protein
VPTLHPAPHSPLTPAAATRWYSVGIDFDERIRAVLRRLPETAWTPALDADGAARPDAQAAELTGLQRHSADGDTLARLAGRHTDLDPPGEPQLASCASRRIPRIAATSYGSATATFAARLATLPIPSSSQDSDPPRPPLRESTSSVAYRILDALATPAYLRNRRFDILAANQQCFALYPGVIAPETLPLNLARFMFLDPRAEEVYLDWDAVADDTVAALRIEAGRTPLDRKLSDLVDELATSSDAFRTRWARHNVRHHRTTAKHLHNPVVGDLTLTGDALELPGEDLILVTYTASADTPAREQLDFLASWTASRTREDASGREPKTTITDC